MARRVADRCRVVLCAARRELGETAAGSGWMQHREKFEWTYENKNPRLRGIGEKVKITPNNKSCFSHVDCAGLLSAIRWLMLRDFEAVAFLPIVYNNPNNQNVLHAFLLRKLEKAGLVTFTPARSSRGERKAFTNYDDLYLTTLASRHAGCVLSGDKFKDIASQKAYEEFLEVIRHRTLDVKFRPLTMELVEFGKDIFYRAAPELFIYENIDFRAKLISFKLFASPDDPDFIKVAARRASFAERQSAQLRCLDELFFDLCNSTALRLERVLFLPFGDIFHPPIVQQSFNILQEQSQFDTDTHNEMDLMEMKLPSYHFPIHMSISYENRTTTQSDVPVGQLVDLDDPPPASLSLSHCSSSPSSPSVPSVTTSSIYIPRSLLVNQIGHSPCSSTSLPSGLMLKFVENVETETETKTMGEGDKVETEAEADRHIDTRMFQLLRAIFPHQIVTQVLCANASRNLDFLAEQCLTLMSTATSS
ncbi:hypothetical protein WR25_22739 [Diploscapter pachys]|uniref:RNase NYN domain-containing protein n=1 Tax=Diploscapter pachys TaxID=2018661 RepID=A0A2A2KUT9_9BILA|nr:hypothetical protein WR25_22739 [Diploscapter pachys]